MKTYKVIRVYAANTPFRQRVIRRGLTLQEAQAHCRDPQTSSRTCTDAAGKRRAKKVGAWFDCFDEEV